MKIAVITLPLLNNYGGNLQAFAMMRLLKNLGHQPVFLNLQLTHSLEFWVKFIIKKYFLFFINKYKNPFFLNRKKCMKRFIDDFIILQSKKICSQNELLYFFKNSNLDACIVGSDQVFSSIGVLGFRDIYSLGFLSDNIIKLSYAASFGGDKYKGGNINFHSQNLKKFKAISVREKSGVKICKEIFGVGAKHVLDPTMMLEASEYKSLFADIKNSKTNGKIFVYILDKNKEKTDAIKKFAKDKNLEVYEINDGNSSQDAISIEEWLKNIYDADIIVTDSFHGCVFSILFNKQFYAFVNKERGVDRFYSLFEMFDLNDRVVNDAKFSPKEIDYKKVDEILKNQKEYSKEFLISNLESNNIK